MEIRNFDAYSPLHKSGHTSKGDQLKWKFDDWWYKADYMGYEGLSEVLVSDLLQKSTCPFPLVEYEAAVIEYNGKIFQGCSSLDFLKANQVLIPLEKLTSFTLAVSGSPKRNPHPRSILSNIQNSISACRVFEFLCLSHHWSALDKSICISSSEKTYGM